MFNSLDEVMEWGSQTTLEQYEKEHGIVLCDVWDSDLELWIAEDIKNYSLTALQKLARTKLLCAKGTRDELLSRLEDSWRVHYSKKDMMVRYNYILGSIGRHPKHDCLAVVTYREGSESGTCPRNAAMNFVGRMLNQWG